jgi:heat shock 70kDa protein 4
VPQSNGESSKIKVKVRVNINGIFSVSSATMTEKIENTAEEAEPMDVDGEKEKKVVENGKEEGKTPDAETPQESQMGSEQASPDKETSNTEEQSAQVCNGRILR